MSEFELHQLLYEAIAEAKSNFDFWLTVSFAALVAGHYTFDQIAKNLKILALSLYGLVSVGFFLRWIDASLVVVEYTDQLAALNAYIPFETPVSPAAFALQTGIMFVGTIAILFFLATSQERKHEDMDT